MNYIRQQFSFYWNIRSLRRSVISGVTLILILLAIPVIIQFSLTHLLIKQGAVKADIEDINLNLFAGTFELKQLTITTADHKPYKLKHLFANIHMLDLLQSKIVVDELNINGLKVDIHRLDNGKLKINGFDLPAANSTPDENEVSDNSETKPVAFGLNKLSILNSHINYLETDFSQINEINALNLTGIKSWDQSNSANLELESRLNGAPFKLTAKLNLFNTIRHFKGTLSLDALSFNHYEKFYTEHLDNLKGNLSLQSEFDVNLSETLSANLLNTIQIAEFDAIYQGINPGFKHLNLQGKSAISEIDISDFLNPKPNQGNHNQNRQLNLLSGTVELDQLTVSTGNNEASRIKHILIDAEKLDMLTNRFVLNNLLIDGLKTNIHRTDDGQISLNGMIIPAGGASSPEQATTEQTTSNPATFGIHKLSLLNSDINYFEPDLNQINHIKSLVVTNLKSWDKSSKTGLQLESTLNNAAFTLTAELTIFDPVKLFSGSASLTSLAFTPYAKFYRDHLDSFDAIISIDSKFNVSLADSISAELSNTIEITDLAANYQDLAQSINKISWKGHTRYSEQAGVSVTGDLQIDKSQTIDEKQNYLVSSFDQLILTGLDQNSESISFQQFDLNDIELITKQQQNSFVGLTKLSIHDAEFITKNSQLKINQIGLENPQINVQITEQKQLAQIIPLQNTIDRMKPAPVDQTQTRSNDESTKPVKIEIGNLKLLNPGTIDFTDLSVTPNYKTLISLNRLDVENISSQNKANFTIGFKQGEYTTFDIEGDGLVFNPKKYMHLSAQIKQLDLPPVTPYSSNIMGYGMKSGVIDSTIQLKLDKHEIDSVVDLKIDSIEVVETDKSTAEQVSSASGMSIDLALSSLKDSENVIDLKLPIKGNIDQPDFDLSQIVNKAMGKAMKSATLTYLKHSLQPFGSLITIFSLAKKAANHISLPPILFKPNSLDFKEEQQDLLDKVIKLLNERPNLKIKACGISAKEDQMVIRQTLLDAEISRLKSLQQAIVRKPDLKSDKEKVEMIDVDTIVIDPELIQQKMRELADNRSAKVKTLFLELGKLESSRILNCLSASSTDEKSVASVELLI